MTGDLKFCILFMTDWLVINKMKKISQKSKEHKEIRKKEILDAAISVFSKKGFHKATLEEIAKKAKVAKATLYLYAKDKYDLLFLVVDEATTLVLSNIENAIKKIQDPLGKLQAIIKIQFETIYKYNDIAKVLLRELPGLEKVVDNKIMEKRQEFVKIFKEVIKDGIKTNQIKEDIDIDLSVSVLIGMSYFWATEWISGKKLPTKKTINNFLNQYLYGIAKRSENRL